ncbi:hypothetical protein MOTT12_02181 [Mycobacterium intracellulare subsp. yongonense]|nr:hypothetical protein [Mycobacterium intracellulare]ARR77845.1 hypothetical protein MOTT12_02181 [Mycobacterium intracellulare subsp. yongonense]
MKLKIDTTAVSFICTKNPEPRTDFGTGQPKIDKAVGCQGQGASSAPVLP